MALAETGPQDSIPEFPSWTLLAFLMLSVITAEAIAHKRQTAP
ncbi:MAG: hypothetical protein NWF00_02235 [Candidatus Bathyarchaeota archaeon]|nr:hypothetical protein [Candidatus Bathyarchaeota archaeon]